MAFSPRNFVLFALVLGSSVLLAAEQSASVATAPTRASTAYFSLESGGGSYTSTSLDLWLGLDDKLSLFTEARVTDLGARQRLFEPRVGIDLQDYDYYGARAQVLGRMGVGSTHGVGGLVGGTLWFQRYWSSEIETSLDAEAGTLQLGLSSADGGATLGQAWLTLTAAQGITRDWRVSLSYTRYLYGRDPSALQDKIYAAGEVPNGTWLTLSGLPNDAAYASLETWRGERFWARATVGETDFVFGPSHLPSLSLSASYRLFSAWSLGAHASKFFYNAETLGTNPTQLVLGLDLQHDW